MMVSYRSVLPLVAFCLVAGEDDGGDSMLKLSNNKKLRQSFNNLLNTVTNVNQQRFDKMKKLYELQSYVPTASRRSSILLAIVIPKPKEEEQQYLNNKKLRCHHGTREVIDIEDDNENDTDECYTGESDTDLSNTDENYTEESETEGCDTNKSNTEENDTEESDTDESNSQETSLRTRCKKKRAKECNDACVSAMEALCLKHKCSLAMQESGKELCSLRKYIEKT